MPTGADQVVVPARGGPLVRCGTSTAVAGLVTGEDIAVEATVGDDVTRVVASSGTPAREGTAAACDPQRRRSPKRSCAVPAGTGPVAGSGRWYDGGAMRKYFTWRCILLHVLVVVLVPTFLLLGRWQYHAALSGNTLSWAYTFEWPAFAVYAVYTWWNLIHERSTALDRIREARERAAAAAAGVPIDSLPGWALDKSLAKSFTEASLGKGHPAALSAGAADRAVGPGGGTGTPDDTPAMVGSGSDPAHAEVDDQAVVEAHVVEVKGTVDEELAAYNRYLADLSAADPPKRW